MSKIYYLVLYCVLLVNSVWSRQVPRFSDLDEEDEKLYRAAYETPSYDNEEYEDDIDLQPGKLDLFKDGLWAIKAKIKELKAFDKALAANLLLTKLKLKDLLMNHMLPIKTHHHVEVEKKKPAHNYYSPSYPQYTPQYGVPPQYGHDPYYGQ